MGEFSQVLICDFGSNGGLQTIRLNLVIQCEKSRCALSEKLLIKNSTIAKKRRGDKNLSFHDTTTTLFFNNPIEIP